MRMRTINSALAQACPQFIHNQFQIYDPSYLKKARGYLERVTDLYRRGLSSASIKGDDPASQQHFVHARWMARYTAHWKRMRRAINRLEQHLSRPLSSKGPFNRQDENDWGGHYREFHHKLDATTERLNRLAETDTAPKAPLDFLAPVGTASEMIGELERLRTSRIAQTGRNQRDEFGGIVSCLAQICFKKKLRRYVRKHIPALKLDQEYIHAFSRFLDRSQNPESGYWGPWFEANGQTHYQDDLSITFHIISYRRGRVRLWPRIIQSTLARSEMEYPYGWKHQGRYNNHNSYDVVKILRHGWRWMTRQQKQQSRDQILQMLNWCVNHTMDLKGRFTDPNGFYSSPANAAYFGISLLKETGGLDEKDSFWGHNPIKEPEKLMRRIANQLIQLDPNDDMVSASWQKLDPLGELRHELAQSGQVRHG